jgi:formylglycine-generating enzyme required for sulfatase activity
MRKAPSWFVLSATVLAAVWASAAGTATARAEWPLWDGKESVADYAKRAGINDVETTLDFGGGVSIKLTLIPAGKFLMGKSPEQVVMIEGVRVVVREADKDVSHILTWSPQREVTLTSPFYMGVYEVTQEQYERVMGTNPSIFKGKTNPVDSPAWRDAALFCKKVSAKTGMNVALPTEAQWEFACQAGTTTKFYWGDDPADTYKFENYADKSMTTGGQKGKIEGHYQRRDQNHDDAFANTAPVGSFKPNPWGLYDINGNVAEWIHDSFTGLFGAPTVDPKGPGYSSSFGGASGASPHFAKGGDWGHGPGLYFVRPQYGGIYGSLCIGFRVVADVKSAAVPAQEAKMNPPKPPAAAAPALAGAGDLKVRVPPGCRAAPGTQAEPYTKSSWAQAIVHEATGMEMVYIPAGSFLMGMAPWTEGELGADETARWIQAGQMTQHRVTLTNGFYMGKHEVTQAQWEKVMGKNPAYFAGKTPEEDVLMKYHAIVAQHDAGPDAPVEMVSWDDCQAFCEKAGGGLRLPTEAEWEYACRAGTKGPYSGNLDDMGWHLGNSDGTTHPVGMKKPNAWGLHDMHGNVWEWCQDWFDTYDKANERTDPTGPTQASGFPQARVIRGGGWGDYGSHCVAAIRGGFTVGGKPGPAFCAVGLRPVIPAINP